MLRPQMVSWVELDLVNSVIKGRIFSSHKHKIEGSSGQCQVNAKVNYFVDGPLSFPWRFSPLNHLMPETLSTTDSVLIKEDHSHSFVG